MKRRTPSLPAPPPAARRAEAMAQVRSRLGELGRMLAQQQAEVLARLTAVEAELTHAGIASPEAIAQAFAAVDAGDREALLRQRVGQAGTPLADPAPARPRKRPRHMV